MEGARGIGSVRLKRGSIEVGKKADFVVLEKDISKIDPTEISGTRIVYTIFGGQTVYEG